MTRRTKIAVTATLITALPLLMAGIAFAARINLKRLFLRTAGFVVEGVKDDVGVVAAISLISLAVLWVVIIACTIYEARIERKAVTTNSAAGNPTVDDASETTAETAAF